MKVFIVNYKETTIDENGVKSVESGVCDYGYLDEATAAEKVSELARSKKLECVKELGYAEDDVDILIRGGDWEIVNCGSNTYEYLVGMVVVED